MNSLWRFLAAKTRLTYDSSDETVAFRILLDIWHPARRPDSTRNPLGIDFANETCPDLAIPVFPLRCQIVSRTRSVKASINSQGVDRREVLCFAPARELKQILADGLGKGCWVTDCRQQIAVVDRGCSNLLLRDVRG